MDKVFSCASFAFVRRMMHPLIYYSARTSRHTIRVIFIIIVRVKARDDNVNNSLVAKIGDGGGKNKKKEFYNLFGASLWPFLVSHFFLLLDFFLALNLNLMNCCPHILQIINERNCLFFFLSTKISLTNNQVNFYSLSTLLIFFVVT